VSTSALSTATSASAVPRKTLWETVLTSTPVLLTVMATILAGLSSSEMTQAQYHRSLAAQYQSKAGDQWGFFQAKRIRGTTLETTVDLLHAVSEPGQVGPEALQTVAALLPREYRYAEAEAKRLLEALAPAKGMVGAAGGAVHDAAEKLLRTATAKSQQAQAVQATLTQVLAEPAVQDAFTYLSTKKVPTAQEIPLENPSVREAFMAVQARRVEADTAPLIASIPEDQLPQAIANAEANLKAFEEADTPISAALGRIEQLVQEQVALARSLQRAIRDVTNACANLPASEAKGLSELPIAVAALARIAASVKTAVEELKNDFTAARHAYTARRYRNEARYNQAAAGLDEVQVSKSSLASERHRLRSRQFFYCMLTAQAGVTIATLSLAMRHKSILWTLASLAGMMALAFGLYVYKYM
jgi:hypothetical protein